LSLPATDDQATILLVVDEDAVRTGLARQLKQPGHHVLVASSGPEALETVRREKVSAVLLDTRLKGSSAIELVPALLELEPTLAILMVTGVNDSTTAALCMQRGAIDYVTQPLDLEHVGRAVTRALQRRHTVLEDTRINRWLNDDVHQRSAELRRERETLERLSVATLEALVNALEAKDPYLRGHSARVADLSAGVASELGLSDEDVEMIRTAGRLHDIGKIGIREEVVNKQGPLTDDEYEHVKQHVLVGSQILAPLVHLKDVISFVRNHHERWDGFGYPDRLKGEAIPLGARVVGAVEIFDALTTSRPYQEKMPAETAVERMSDLIGSVIDTSVHGALEAVVKRRQALTFLDDSEDG
jgi:putative nucleotidyltransferase with HDIG domain